MSELIEIMNKIGDNVEQISTNSKENFEVIEQKFKALDDRLGLIEAQADRPHANGNAQHKGFSRDAVEHKEKFEQWIRRPYDGSVRRQLDEAQAEIREKALKESKAVTVGTPSAGGYAVPEIIDSQVEARVRLLNPFRSLVRVMQAGSRDYKQLVSKNNSSNGWVGEGDSRTETTTSELLERAPTFGTVYAYPKASEESLQDIFFNVEQWLVEEAGDGFAAAEATSIVSGDGVKKPTGFLNTAPVSTADDASPERAAGTLQFIAPTASSPTSLLTNLADGLISLAYSVKEPYLLDTSGVAFVMRRSTAAVVRKLKDPSTGLYLWGESLVAGQPPTLLGYPVKLTDAMPAIANDANVVAFGNWKRGYLLADRVGSMQITVDSNITTPGQVKFYLRRVVGGTILNHEALKTLKVSD